jgi:hypothetical protein
MTDHSGAALDVANAVLARMLADDGPSWTVLDAIPSDTSHVRITVGSGPAPRKSSPSTSRPASRGQMPSSPPPTNSRTTPSRPPAPRCPPVPVHAHPLSTRMLDNVALGLPAGPGLRPRTPRPADHLFLGGCTSLAA